MDRSINRSIDKWIFFFVYLFVYLFICFECFEDLTLLWHFWQKSFFYGFRECECFGSTENNL